jgi:3-phosphoshikimate 1-carboxyvinyltransferase
MNVTMTPTNIVGTVTPPGSKSVLHRALVLALLSKGTSVISKVSLSDDIQATIAMVQAFGAAVTIDEAERTITVTSTGGLNAPVTPIDCKESGTTYRFAVALAMTLAEDVVITGAKGLLARPIDGYDSLATTHNIQLILDAKQLIVKGTLVASKNWVVDGSKSSQFVSGLLLAALRYDEPITIEILKRLSSPAYVDITTQVIAQFGGVVTHDNPLFHVEQGLLSATDYEIEVDYSQAAVWFLARTFFPGIDVITSESLSTQPDQFMEEFLRTHSIKQGFEVDVDATPDIAPLLMLFASQCHGTSIIRGTSRLRFKESDRVASSLTTLQAFGASSIIRDNEVVIKGPVQLLGATVDSYQDHRIVMMATLAALLAKGTTTIRNAEAITKSYPSFFQDLKQVGGRYEISS